MLTAMDISPTVALSVLTPSPRRDGEHQPPSASQRELDVAVSLGIGVLAVETSADEPGTRFRMPLDSSRGTSGRLEPPMSADRTSEAVAGADGCLPTSGELLAGLNRLRDVLAQVQRDIENLTVHGNSRGNEVTATMQGSGKLVDIAIDPDRARHHTPDDLTGSVTEAVNDALQNLGDATKARMASLLAAQHRD
jgi:DNA-binding protein YbaB